MNNRSCRVVLSLFVVAVLLAAPASLHADVRLPSIFSSHMVMQRGQALPVWGWADPGEMVKVTLGEKSASATADKTGRWQVTLPAMKAGGPIDMTVAGKNAIKLTDVMIGEVWVCSGQSNMEWSVAASANPKEEIAAADHPGIRFFRVPQHLTSGRPRHNVPGAWVVCNPKTIARHTAVGYYFGRHLHKQLDVPIGLIDSNWGGTRIEPWTPPAGFKAVEKTKYLVDHINNAEKQFNTLAAKTIEQAEAWVAAAKAAQAKGDPIPEPPAWPQHALNNGGRPTGIYNAMIHPIVPYAIRGAIWYQGESNRGMGMHYRDLMEALITGWRTVWNQPDNRDFPFIFVQLAPYNYGNQPTALPEIWEAQTAALKLPNTGMAVTVDIGNVRDIHPRNKQDVGKRLALWALGTTYGKTDLVYSGPLIKAMKVADGKAVLSFDHVGGGLATRDGMAPSHFQIAGPNKAFVPAKTRIEGDTVVVWSEMIDDPAAVRYAWDHTAEPNLMNKEGLPASPFRTDDWGEEK